MNIYNMLCGDISLKELLNYHNANITYIDLSNGINGFVFEYENIYNIFINKNLSYYKKKKTIIHELAHIELNQFNQYNKDLFAFQIDKYEDEADRYIIFLLNTVKEQNKGGKNIWNML